MGAPSRQGRAGRRRRYPPHHRSPRPPGTTDMKQNQGQSTSVWMATVPMPSPAPLGADTRADVCVVGAGIAGLTTAYLLAGEGRSVVVLDSGPVASGQTQRTTAH